MIRALGADLSLTSSGFCLPVGRTLAIVPNAQARGVVRLDWMERELRWWVMPACLGTDAFSGLPLADVCVLEEPAYGRSGSGTIGLGEWRGIFLLAFHRAEIPVVEVNPSTLKKFATGKGTADKSAMAVAAFERAGRKFRTDDECDAWWLQQAALVHYGCARIELPKLQREAIEKVAWPELRRAG